jgi:hypothetical protein
VRASVVEIVNPVPGSSRFTTRKRADHLVRRRYAVFAADGRLRLLEEYELLRLQSEISMKRQDAEYERQIQIHRGGIVYGEWKPTTCGSSMPGGPKLRTLQCALAVKRQAEE